MSIYDLLRPRDEAYEEKMMHRVPPSKVVEREVYLLFHAKGKTILDIGATGPMHDALRTVAKRCYGIDIIEKEEPDYLRVDIDLAQELPHFEELEIIIAGEVIEHLSNPGHFLDLLKRYDCPIILTTPNAFTEAGRAWILRGIEQVNREHVAYYSWKTISVLLERHGYEIKEFCWYNGKPLTAEGIVVKVLKRA